MCYWQYNDRSGLKRRYCEVISFNISDFRAISFNLGGEYDRQPDISRVAPISRRRLSQCAKFCVDITSQIKLDMPIVFSSYFGETNRCLDLLNVLKSEVSPTAFSLSVLNATPAMLSIEAKNNSPVFAISAMASLEYAIINALKFQKAFVISYFEGANKDYYKNDPFAVAIGMMITKGDKFSLKFSPDNRSANYSEICFLENYGKNSSWCSFDGALKWEYRCNY